MRLEWDWWQDFIIYLTYFGVRKAIPEDIYRAHRIRQEINTHVARASLMVSLFEFIERFGVSTAGLYLELDAVNTLEKEAEECYRRDDYDGAARIFEEVHAAWSDLEAKAMEVKDSALLWVYLIEWLVVMGVAIASAAGLWGLMVRRRLFREVRITKARQASR